MSLKSHDPNIDVTNMNEQKKIHLHRRNVGDNIAIFVPRVEVARRAKFSLYDVGSIDLSANQ